MMKQVVLHALLVGWAASAPDDRMGSQCPSVCKCNRTAIVCHDSHLRSADIFHQLSPSYWTDLATVEVSAGEPPNDMGDLSAQNLFGVNEVHRTVDLLNLTGNAITAIDDKTFEGLPNLQVLDLSNNRLERIGGDVFVRAPRLTELYMRNAISAAVNQSTAADMLHTLFAESENDFADLSDLVLDANNLVYLKPDTFCRLKGLDRLSLRNNDLASLAMSESCRPGPHELDLSGNELRYVSKTTVHIWDDALIHLQVVDFSANPWACDCDNEPLLRWMQENYDLFVHKENTLCKGPSLPAHLENKSIFDVDLSELQCPEDGSTHSGARSFYILLLVLTVVGGLVLAACCVSRWRRGLAAAMNKPYRGVVGGYHKLDGAQEPQVTAEFV